MVQKLIEHNLKIATAESCTGGMISSYITDFSGASAIFDMGFVTYSNEAKIKLLGVSEETLKNYGAVSKETALEMSRGAMLQSGSDIGVSVTGIAGPGGGTPEKPVGLVYISLCSKQEHIFYKLNLKGNREEIRSQTVNETVEMIENHLEKWYN